MIHRYPFYLMVVFVFLFAAFWVIPAAMGQSTSATLSGTVEDERGAVIPGVTVTAVNTGTQLSRDAVTNDQGYFRIPLLPPGAYTLKAHAQGFAPVEFPNVVLNVGDQKALQIQLKAGDINATVQVINEAPLIEESPAVSTVIDRQFVANLPLNGRNINTLLQLTPGVVVAPSSGQSPGQFSIAGQRTDANNFTVDGASANFGVGSALFIPGSGTGTAQAFTVLGGTSSLVSVDALQEFRIETSSYAPEFGRSPGGQVILTTRSGTNDFHGGAFDYFRNTVMDANDWFANAAGLPRAPEHHNDFGGFFGGPIWKSKTFFFGSYEGARLTLPQTAVKTVPSIFARTQAPATLAPFLNAFPLPTGQPASPTAAIAPFTGSFSNIANLDAFSMRVDHTFNDRFSIFGRYNNAPSSLNGVAAAFLPSNPSTTTVNTQTLTFGANMLLTTKISNVLRGNYSTQSSGVVFAQNSFGGAKPVDPSLLLGGLAAATTFLSFGTSDTSSYFVGTNAANRTKQLNLVDDLSWNLGAHQLKLGGDYRAIFLDKKPFAHDLLYSARSVQSFLSTGKAFLFPSTATNAKLLTQAFSLYVQDTWKVRPRLTLTYGLRWELNPAPSARGTTTLAAWTNVNNPAALALAPPGTPVWRTTYGNFAPRVGVAYSLRAKGDLVLRAGGGIFYDLGSGQTLQLANSFPNFASGNPASVSLPLANATPFVPILSLQPPFSGVVAYSPNLKLPRSYQWNVALEKSFQGKQVISATYVGQAGRDLLRQEALFQPNPNFTDDFLLTQNDGRSNYNALQVQYRRPLSSRVQALLNYTWSRSLDNASNDFIVGLSNTVISAASDYAPSGFDVRHSFSGAITYEIPGLSRYKALSVLTKDWSVNTVIVARSGFPFNAILAFESADPGFVASTRPDLVPGQPLWVSAPNAPGGRMLNSDAFAVPPVDPVTFTVLRQGTEGRNDIRGFGLTQVDFSIVRKFPITERVNLQFRADAFNLFNHPNFSDPNGAFELGTFGTQSIRMLNKGLGGLNPLFQEGGPRSFQLSLKLTF